MLLLAGCVSQHNPQPADTKFDDSKRNWIEIYERELMIAIKNGDAEGYHFFTQELIKERNRFLIEEIRIWNENKTNKAQE